MAWWNLTHTEQKRNLPEGKKKRERENEKEECRREWRKGDGVVLGVVRHGGAVGVVPLDVTLLRSLNM